MYVSKTRQNNVHDCKAFYKIQLNVEFKGCT